MPDPRFVKKVPRHVDPRKLAAQGTHLQGLIPPEELSRLAQAVIEADRIEVDLVFDRDREHRAVVDGHYSLTVSMSCQRCLQPVVETISGEIHAGVVWDESRAAELPKSLDPWLVDTESADLYEMLEDEFLLSLPIVPYHDEKDCASRGSFSTGEHEETRENPFSILAKLKNSGAPE